MKREPIFLELLYGRKHSGSELVYFRCRTVIGGRACWGTAILDVKEFYSVEIEGEECRRKPEDLFDKKATLILRTRDEKSRFLMEQQRDHGIYVEEVVDCGDHYIFIGFDSRTMEDNEVALAKGRMFTDNQTTDDRASIFRKHGMHFLEYKPIRHIEIY